MTSQAVPGSAERMRGSIAVAGDGPPDGHGMGRVATAGALLIVVLVSAAACAGNEVGTREITIPPPGGNIVDLSHTFDAATIFWPTSEPFTLETVSAGVTDAGYYYAANNFSTSEHGGTHLDAPIHFAEGRRTVDRIPLERLVGPAVIVDVTEASEGDPDYQVTIDDVVRAEIEDGPIPPGSIVLIRTGYSTRWPDAERYLGTAARGADAVADLHFPGLHPETARWLIDNRSITAIGIDTASIDYGQSTLYESHRALFARDIPAFENLTSLEQLPRRGASVIALPMKIGGGSGAPLRAIAIVP